MILTVPSCSLSRTRLDTQAGHMSDGTIVIRILALSSCPACLVLHNSQRRATSVSLLCNMCFVEHVGKDCASGQWLLSMPLHASM